MQAVTGIYVINAHNYLVVVCEHICYVGRTPTTNHMKKILHTTKDHSTAATLLAEAFTIAELRLMVNKVKATIGIRPTRLNLARALIRAGVKVNVDIYPLLTGKLIPVRKANIKEFHEIQSTIEWVENCEEVFPVDVRQSIERQETDIEVEVTPVAPLRLQGRINPVARLSLTNQVK